MKTLLLILSLVSTSLVAQSVGDYILPEKVSTTGRVTNRFWPKGAGKLWGTDANSLPQSITIGSGLTLTGSTLTSSGGSGGGTWGSITGTLSAQTDLNTALGLKAPLASPTFTGTVAAPDYTLSASAVDTLTALQYGIGWRDDRFTLQGPEGALQMYETGDPLESVLYWAGRLSVGSLEAAEITGEITGALVTSGVIPASVMEASLTQPLSAFIDLSTKAGIYGLTYANTGPAGVNEPTNPGTYYAQILVVDGDPNENYLQGRIRSKAQMLADLDLEIGTDVQAYSASTSLLGSSIDLTSEVTGILPPANMGTGSSITTKYLRGDGTWQAISGGGDALTSGNLSQFAATTSAQLRGVLSDESGTDVFLTANGNGSALTGITHTQVSGLGTLATQSATITDYLTTATAASTYQPLDGDLTTYAGITPAANVQSLLGAADYSAMRSQLGLVIGTNVQAYDADLTTYAGITPAANVQSLLGAADYSAMRSQLGLVIGTNVQAYDADLDDLADGSLTGTLVAAASTSARGSVELATDGETSASVAVQGNDTRLANAGKVEIGVAISDETTAITTGTAKTTFRMPYAMTLTAVRLSLTTVSSSGTPTVDINEAGATILSTKLTCDASEKTSTTAATAAVISDTALADDAEITIDIDTAGTGATGAKVWLIGTR